MVAHKYITNCELFAEHSTRQRPRRRQKMTVIRITVIQMMILNRNLLRGKLCDPIFIMVTSKKEKRDKEIVHKVLFISSIVAHKYITYCKLFIECSTRKGPGTRTK